MKDLSVVIPARNEEFLQQTIDSVISASEADTEVIVVLDGYWPEPGIKDHPKVTIIHFPESIGQRAAQNVGVRYSQAKYVMKLDAHCKLDKGFDRKLIADMQPDWTVVPRMYNLHAFDWKCQDCGRRTYQGTTPEKCDKCNGKSHKKVIVWKEKRNPESTSMRFDRDLRFKYWREYKRKQKGKLVETMSLLGACFMIDRKRYWEIEICDEGHGGWGQQGTEVACKTWLSGGRLICNKNTWFSHMFRTKGGDFGFPYPIRGRDVSKARRYSKKLWLNDNWPKAKHDLNWLLEKFKPVPDWHDGKTKGLVYYTDNRCEERILHVARKHIEHSTNGHAIVSVSQYPIKFGKNFVMPIERSVLSMFRQILRGLAEIATDIVFLVEHDVIYNASHFKFTPSKDNVFYYNKNVWKVDAKTGQALHYDGIKQVSGLVAYRDLLVEHYRKRVERVEKEGFTRRMGFEPGKKLPHGIDNHKYEYFESKHPLLDIKHGNSVTRGRFRLDQYRCRERIKDSWTLSDEVPYWGKSKGRFDDFLREVSEKASI